MSISLALPPRASARVRARPQLVASVMKRTRLDAEQEAEESVIKRPRLLAAVESAADYTGDEWAIIAAHLSLSSRYALAFVNRFFYGKVERLQAKPADVLRAAMEADERPILYMWLRQLFVPWPRRGRLDKHLKNVGMSGLAAVRMYELTAIDRVRFTTDRRLLEFVNRPFSADVWLAEVLRNPDGAVPMTQEWISQCGDMQVRNEAIKIYNACTRACYREVTVPLVPVLLQELSRQTDQAFLEDAIDLALWIYVSVHHEPGAHPCTIMDKHLMPAIARTAARLNGPLVMSTTIPASFGTVCFEVISRTRTPPRAGDCHQCYGTIRDQLIPTLALFRAKLIAWASATIGAQVERPATQSVDWFISLEAVCRMPITL